MSSTIPLECSTGRSLDYPVSSARQAYTLLTQGGATATGDSDVLYSRATQTDDDRW